MKPFYKKNNISRNMKKNNNSTTMLSKLSKRIGSLRRKMSRGASNIFRMIKTRDSWGNKKLWGYREKGRNHPGRKTPKK